MSITTASTGTTDSNATTGNAVAKFFDFPNPVNEKAARVVAGGAMTMAAFVAILGWGWVLIPLAFGFMARVTTGPRFSPLGLFATRIAAPRLGDPKLVPGPPKRFAQAIGVVFSLTASALWIADLQGAARVVAAMLMAAAALESIFGFCLGCTIFGWLMRIGVIPDDVCADCADISDRLDRTLETRTLETRALETGALETSTGAA